MVFVTYLLPAVIWHCSLDRTSRRPSGLWKMWLQQTVMVTLQSFGDDHWPLTNDICTRVYTNFIRLRQDQMKDSMNHFDISSSNTLDTATTQRSKLWKGMHKQTCSDKKMAASVLLLYVLHAHSENEYDIVLWQIRGQTKYVCSVSILDWCHVRSMSVYMALLWILSWLALWTVQIWLCACTRVQLERQEQSFTRLRGELFLCHERGRCVLQWAWDAVRITVRYCGLHAVSVCNVHIWCTWHIWWSCGC